MSDPPANPLPGQTEHERIAELLRAVDVRAPERLHRRVRAMVDPHERGGARGVPHERGERGLTARLRPTLAAMALAAVAGAAIALLTGGATEQGLSVRAASALTLRTATLTAPHEINARRAQLDAAVEGVAFPYWQDRFGWRSTGARTDTLGGRTAMTVFYASARGGRIGYAIVGGGSSAQSALAGLGTTGTSIWRGGTRYRLLREDGRSVVVWARAGRLCVLSGSGVSGATLLALASWGDAVAGGRTT